MSPSHRLAFCLLLAATLAPGSRCPAQTPVPPSPVPTPAALEHDLKTFAELGSVLYVAAHPDDENTQLITYLARGRGYRTAYLSITRGDGGQNELGPEFDEKLGVARTQELLAARGLDGGQQFFTRALDFGFSKDYRETLRIWDRQAVLGDVVRVIRTFQPDVIITRFSPEPSTTHGHHTASAVLAIEAFKLAADPAAYPEQLTTLRPWQARRILQNSGNFGGQGRGNRAPPAGAFSIEAGGNDPVTGESFGSIAARSRAMHKTQGFGNFGAGAAGGPRQESFTLLGGEPATRDILDGVDSTWARFPGGAELAGLAAAAGAAFNPARPAASVPALLALRTRVLALPAGPVAQEKLRQLDHLVQELLGLTVLTTVAGAEVVPGETIALQHRVTLTADYPVRWIGTRYPLLRHEDKFSVALGAGQPAGREGQAKIPGDTPPTQPYWLRQPSTAGMFVVADASLIGRAQNPPAFPVEQLFSIDGQVLAVADQPVQSVPGASAAQALRPLVVIPPASLRFPAGVELFAPGATKEVAVEITAARNRVHGAIGLNLPAGWRVEPRQEQFQLGATGDQARVAFRVTAPAQPASADLSADAEIDGGHYNQQRILIDYPHIPRQLLQPAARLRVVALDLATRGQRVGYVPGAGDSVAGNLRQMGYQVTDLGTAELTAETLRPYDAVVLGVRAWNENKALAKNLPALFAYVRDGGNVIAQYNRPNGLRSAQLGPYPLSIEGDAPRYRVTDEEAPVTLLQPDSPALTTPNRITADDFKGWVQERGAYFPSSWDPARYTPILAMSDPGEPPLEGSLLIAREGRGYFVYTGLAFFRQLPAGVPGAYRLFANLVSLGK